MSMAINGRELLDALLADAALSSIAADAQASCPRGDRDAKLSAFLSEAAGETGLLERVAAYFPALHLVDPP